jgi:hypothetical protein
MLLVDEKKGRTQTNLGSCHPSQENRGSNQTVISVFKNVVGKESQSSAGR